MKHLALILLASSSLLQSISLPTQRKQKDFRKINELLDALDVPTVEKGIKRARQLGKKSESFQYLLNQGLGVKSMQDGMSKLEKLRKQERRDAKKFHSLEDEITQLKHENDMLEQKLKNAERAAEEKVIQKAPEPLYEEIVHEVVEEDEPIKIPPPPRRRKAKKRTTIRPMKRLASD